MVHRETIHATYQEADTYVNEMKNDYGKGVSTLITWGNESNVDLQFKDKTDSSGHIWNEINYPNTIPTNRYASILHTHTAGAARGSVANLVYSFPGNGKTLYAIVAFNTPWSGTNSIYVSISDTVVNELGTAAAKGLQNHSAENFGYSLKANVNSSTSPRLSIFFSNI